VITTNLPIVSEYQGGSLPILSDYHFSDTNINIFHNRVIYNAIVPYRKTALLSSGSITNIACYVYVRKTDGSLIPLNIGNDQSSVIKLMFTIGL